jgi:hypothetical protein
MSGGSWIRINAVAAHLDAKTVNAIVAEALGKRAVSITKKPELRQAIGQEFVRAVTPFVPMKTGALRQSGKATTDGRVYWSAVRTTTSEDGEESAGYNYAASTYDAEGVRWPSGEYKKPSTPNTYPRWVEKFLEEPSRYDAFKNNIIPIIVEGFNEDG